LEIILKQVTFLVFFECSTILFSGFLPQIEQMSGYYLYETLMTMLAFVINGISFTAVGPRADDYSGFIVVLCSAMDMICLMLNLFSRVVSFF
jgi:hypothetical protein